MHELIVGSATVPTGCRLVRGAALPFASKPIAGSAAEHLAGDIPAIEAIRAKSGVVRA